MTNSAILLLLSLIFLSSPQIAEAQLYDTKEAPMMRSVTQNIKSDWDVDPIFTVGETDPSGTDFSLDRFGYRVPGVMDGMYAFRKSRGKVDLLVNHELRDERGYPFKLRNCTELSGSRVTRFRLEQKNDGFGIRSAGLAFHTIYDRYYLSVKDPAQLNEGANPGSIDGIDRLCSATGIRRNNHGFVSDIFFTGEETIEGQEFVLDDDKEILYCAPAMGRAAWESVCVMDNLRSNKVVVLIGDDRGGAPLLLYVGEKNASFADNDPHFLRKNGLAKGNLFVWVADSGDQNPNEWNGTDTYRSGKFVKIDHHNPAMAGQEGWDDTGWASMVKQDELAAGVGAFQFSRPEDVATNPHDGSQAIFASTGRSSLFPSDAWGTVYLVDIDKRSLYFELRKSLAEMDEIKANLSIVYDGDDSGAGQFSDPDFGLRSPDNLDWAADGFVYINEDRSVGDFCLTSGLEASVWQLNPQNGDLIRILEMDRNAVPYGQTDSDPDDCGDWESSGTIDVTHLFRTDRNETLLLINVQAHSVDDDEDEDSPIGGDDDLSEGGQLLFISKTIQSANSKIQSGIQEEIGLTTETRTDFVFPNPAKSIINLSEISDVSIYDALGVLVIQKSEVNQIDVSSLNMGIYYLKTNGDTHKILIQ